MNIELYNDWYVRTDGRLGPYTVTTSQQPTAEQIHNATKIYYYFNALGWSLSAICGMIGNMMHESTINPAFIQATHRNQLPNSAANLSDVPNSVMLSFYGSGANGIGLVQWDGSTNTPPAGQKLVSFAERYNMIWYDGDCQTFRIQREQETNIQWTSHTYYGITWTWSNYINNTRTPEESAHIWRRCYEVAAAGDTESATNARWFYDYFSDNPPGPGPGPGPTPTEWILGTDFATLALAYDPDVTGTDIPYSQMDCIQFVQTVWKDIQAVNPSWVLCTPLGTNTLWRCNTQEYPSLSKTFATTSPDNQNPTPVLWWKGTITECEQQFGSLPAGTLLFHQISEAGPPAIPSSYAGDGIGNFAHVGIYCGNNEVMQSGGRDSASVPGGGVHKSTYDSSAWNYAAFVVYVDCMGAGPPIPPVPWINSHLYLLFNQRKKVLKNVKRYV